MKFSKFSTDMVAELLVYLADHDKFESLKGFRDISRADVQNVLEELAEQVQQSGERQPLVRKTQLSDKELAQKTTQVISKLTPREEEILLRSFRIS